MSSFSLDEIGKRVIELTDEAFHDFKPIKDFEPQLQKAILAACTINAQVLTKLIYEFQLNQD